MRTSNTITAENMRSLSLMESNEAEPGARFTFKDKIICQFRIFKDDQLNQSEKPLASFAQELLNILIRGGPQPINSPCLSLNDVKHYSASLLKCFRNELAYAQSTYVQQMNEDLKTHEANFKDESIIKAKSKSELITVIKHQGQTMLKMRTNEILLQKVCHQLRLLHEFLPLCSFQQNLSHVASKIFENEWSGKAQRTTIS